MYNQLSLRVALSTVAIVVAATASTMAWEPISNQARVDVTPRRQISFGLGYRTDNTSESTAQYQLEGQYLHMLAQSVGLRLDLAIANRVTYSDRSDGYYIMYGAGTRLEHPAGDMAVFLELGAAVQRLSGNLYGAADFRATRAGWSAAVGLSIRIDSKSNLDLGVRQLFNGLGARVFVLTTPPLDRPYIPRYHVNSSDARDLYSPTVLFVRYRLGL